MSGRRSGRLTYPTTIRTLCVMKRVFVALATITALFLGGAWPASAAREPYATELKTVKKASTTDCDTGSAYLRIYSKATDAPDLSKSYYLKSKISWKQLIGTDRWREDDTSTLETRHAKPTSSKFYWYLDHQDRTVWASNFGRQWKAEVTLTFMQERKGPDKTVWQGTRTFTKAVFAEQNRDPSTCIYARNGGKPGVASVSDAQGDTSMQRGGPDIKGLTISYGVKTTTATVTYWKAGDPGHNATITGVALAMTDGSQYVLERLNADNGWQTPLRTRLRGATGDALPCAATAATSKIVAARNQVVLSVPTSCMPGATATTKAKASSYTYNFDTDDTRWTASVRRG